MDLFDWFINGE